MSYLKPRVLRIEAKDFKQRGEIHGETLRDSVREMAQIRMELMQSEAGFASEHDVLELAKRHLPFLRNYDQELLDELMGIAHGSNLSPEHIVVLNHFTDMRDLKPGAQYSDDPGGCSSVYLPPPGGPTLGQTWDIHATAMRHVFILDLGEQLIFSVAGCLGMTGMNRHGLGVTVNNLVSLDACIGVVWPAVVRKALKQSSAEQAKNEIWNTRLGSGHHYLLADNKNVFGIETSGTKKKITQTGGDQIHFHTNHCLDNEMAQTHTIKSTSTTHARYEELTKITFGDHSAQALYEALGRVSIEPNAKLPTATATCGAFVMDLSKHQALACMGPASESLFHNPPLLLDMNP